MVLGREACKADAAEAKDSSVESLEARGLECFKKGGAGKSIKHWESHVGRMTGD